jgi:hypothetical integral membrane protein (TIGR02206 family)
MIFPMPATFAVFSSTHGTAVLMGFVVLLILLLIARRSARGKTIATGLLAFFCLAAYGYSQWAWSTCTDPVSLDNRIPFHLCDFAGFIAGYALLSRKPLARELTFYWGLAATLQALITPALTYNFPHPTFFTFFLHHFAIVGAALFLPICDGWRPQWPFWRSPLRAFLWVNVYLLFAGLMNVLLDTNFGFLAHPPPNPSLIDHLGPWPWYILSFEIIALLLFGLLTLPFLRKNRATGSIAG